MKTALIYDKWLLGLGGGEVVACAMATSLRDKGYNVTILSQDPVPSAQISLKLGIDLSNISLTTNPKLLTTKSEKPDLFINLSFMDYTYGIGRKNIYYVHFPTPIRPFLFNLLLFILQYTKTIFPKLYTLIPIPFRERINDRLRAGIYHDMKKRLDSYHLFLANSQFTQKWIKKYWGKESKILYPPVSLHLRGDQNYLEGVKRNWIVSVGRFFTLGHGKKQEVMIEAFKQLYDKLNPKSETLNPNQIPKSKIQISNKPENQLSRNQELTTNDCQLTTNKVQLHLIGGVGSEPSSLRFVEQLKKMANGYPIYFHFNITRKEVEDILLKSKIYWHAAGYGEDPKKDPVKFEHFGIAPIEAVSAGCIPILYNGGGLPEIISLLGFNPDKHLFRTIDELIYHTKHHLAHESNQHMNTSVSAFSAKTFVNNCCELLLST